MTEVSRRSRTILLLETRGSWNDARYPRSEFAKYGGLSGEKATEVETCSACHGECQVPSRYGPQPCERCDGKGKYRVDGYTRFRSREEGPWRTGGLTMVEKRRLSDAEIQRMDTQLAPPKSELDLIDEANQHPEPWESSREAHYERGSYRELDLALEWLAGRAPNMRQLVQWIYEDGLIAPGPETATRALMAVDAVAERMPDPIRVPPWVLPDAPGGPAWARRQQAARRKAAA